MVGSRQTSDHAPSCTAGRLPDADCALTSCRGDPEGSIFVPCPEDCPAPPPGSEGAYPTTFRFTAPAGETLFLRDECGYGAEISACTDGYAHALHRPFCQTECMGENTPCLLCEACEILAVPVTSTDGADFRSCLNTSSLQTLDSCRVEPSVAGPAPGSRYQFERLGYFCVDPDSSAESLVFNRTATLRDPLARIQKAQGGN